MWWVGKIIIWGYQRRLISWYFMKQCHKYCAQGYKARIKLHQNKITDILWERNGVGYSSKLTKLINIPYLFIKDKITSKNIEFEHSPMEHMRVYTSTKPSQVHKSRSPPPRSWTYLKVVPKTTWTDMSKPQQKMWSWKFPSHRSLLGYEKPHH